MTDDWTGVSRFVTYAEVVKPDRENAAIYDEGYRRFRRTYCAMADAR